MGEKEFILSLGEKNRKLEEENKSLKEELDRCYAALVNHLGVSKDILESGEVSVTKIQQEYTNKLILSQLGIKEEK